MIKFCIFIGTTAGSYAGWAVGEWLGWEMMGCFLLSGVGSILGVVVGWKIARRIAGY